MNRIASAVLLVAAALIVFTWVYQGQVQAKSVPSPLPEPEVARDEEQPKDGAWLGIVISNITPKVAERLGLGQQQGVVIINVAPDSPAAKADLKPKDILTSVNGVAVSTAKAAVEEVRKAKPGDTVSLGILRDGQSLTINVTAGSRPAVQPKPPVPLQFPKLKELEGVPPQELFNHFLGLELNILDKNNQPATVRLVPGTVTSVGTNALSITPNGSSTPQTFNVTGDTQIYIGLKKGKLEDIKAGDKVVILASKGSSDARGIFDLRAASLGSLGRGLLPGLMVPGLGRGFHLPQGFFFPQRQPQPEPTKTSGGSRL